MSKFLIVYDTTYGNTKVVAEKIAQGIEEIEGSTATVRSVKEIRDGDLTGKDVLLIGSPTHFGTSTLAVKRFISRIGNSHSKIEAFAFFATFMKGDTGKAVKHMEERLRAKAPDLKVFTPGLSIDVQYDKGPVPETEITKCIEYGRNLATNNSGLTR